MAESNSELLRSTPSTAQIVVEILELLDACTDREHGLSAAEIGKRIHVTEKTVRGHLRTLRDLQPFGRRVEYLERRDLRNASSADPRPGWYITPIFDTAQMRLLADGAALSPSDGEYLNELIARVYELSGKTQQLHKEIRLSTPRNYNTEYLSNVEMLNDAIVHERVIGFRYCTYDIDGALVPRTDADGRPKEYRADPYSLMYKNNKYYLICHMHQHDGLSYLHVERLRHLNVDQTDHSITRTLDSFSPVPGAPFDLVRHMSERPYPMDGRAVPIHMRIKRTLEPLYDWFDDATVTRIDDETYDVRIMGNELATFWWALQYADTRLIEILSPQSLRARLHDAGAYLVEQYAEKEKKRVER
ncbi:DNA-binding protein [Bifidobacterium callitrichos]|nr:DNA-binding protein [Bifidobacterium callitrichos]